MNIKSVFTAKPSAAEAAADIKNQLASFDVKMLIYFASWETYKPDEIAAQMQSAFPDSVVYGGSSHAELYNGKTLKGSVTAMAFNTESILDAKVEVIENINSGVNVEAAFASFDAYFAAPMADADYRVYGGIVLIDGLSLKEEEVMDEIGSRTNIMFTGGSASDAFKFDKRTYVYANGKAYYDAALLAIFKTKNGIDYIKTQSVDVTDIALTVTKAEGRAIIEFDNKPAAIRYAEVLGVARNEIEPLFFANPVGLVIDSDVYIRACPKCDGDTMIYYCSIMEGTEVKLCKIRNIIPDIKATIENKVKELGSIAGIIDFRCAFRTVQLEIEGTIDEYAKVFDGIQAIGFSSYGEQHLGHMNQTSTMLVFK